MSWDDAIKKIKKAAQLSFVRPVIKPAVIDWDRLVTIDFETYYDQQYTLSKLSTSEYVRDPRFKAQMMGMKVGNKPTKIYGPKQIKSALQSINWATHSLLCHNTQFDGFILSHCYGVVPHQYHDTLSMARGLHSNEIGASLDEVAHYYGKGSKIEGALETTKGVLDWPKAMFDNLAKYCTQDVDLTFEIFKEMHAKFPENEMALVDLTVRMFCDPVLKVDIPRVEAELARELERREKLFFSVVNPVDYEPGGKLFDAKEHKDKLFKGPAERAMEGTERAMHLVKRVIGNNEKFAQLLRDEGVEPPLKVSQAYIKLDKDAKLLVAEEDKWSYAFAKDDTEFISIPDNIDLWRGALDPNKKKDVPLISAKQDRLRNLVDCRLAVKSTTNITRAERFLTAGADGMNLPVGYAYARAHTLRWGGNNKMNMQNLTRGGELRLSILAPKGHQLCVVDSGQIEARVNGWLWGQNDLMDAFRSADKWDKSKGVARGKDRDAYCLFGDQVYGREITTDDKMERFVGKVCVLGLGYSMGAPKFQMTLAKGALGGPPVFFELDRCKDIVMKYRRMNYKIEQGWRKCNQIIEDMAAGRTGTYGPIAWEKETIWMPNGLSLKYPDLKQRIGDNGWNEWSYQAGDVRAKIYGGLLCLSSNTEVLTATGWKAIISVVQTDLLWDGIEWVAHEGLINKGIRETIDFGGIGITPDHEVLVNECWVPAGETTYHEATSSCARHYRIPLRDLAGHPSYWKRRAQDLLESTLRLWNNKGVHGKRAAQGVNKFMRVPDSRVDLESKDNPRYEQASSIRRVAQYEVPMHQQKTSRLEKLRRKGHYGLQRMAHFVRDVLGGYGAFIPVGDGHRPDRQLSRVFFGELSVGDPTGKFCQPANNRMGANPQRADDFDTSRRSVLPEQNNTELSAQKRVSSRTNVRQPRTREQVYDLVNAGPRHRFTVRGTDGRPFIVHNCENLVQCLARIIIGEQMLQISRKYRVVMTTHDEVVAMPKTREAEKCFEFMTKVMSTPLSWCSDIPLNCEGGWAQNYSK